MPAQCRAAKLPSYKGSALIVIRDFPLQGIPLHTQVEDEFSIYGVFDGHGRKGHDVSNFIKDRHRLNGYLAQWVPSLFLASGFRMSLED